MVVSKCTRQATERGRGTRERGDARRGLLLSPPPPTLVSCSRGARSHLEARCHRRAPHLPPSPRRLLSLSAPSRGQMREREAEKALARQPSDLGHEPRALSCKEKRSGLPLVIARARSTSQGANRCQTATPSPDRPPAEPCFPCGPPLAARAPASSVFFRLFFTQAVVFGLKKPSPQRPAKEAAGAQQIIQFFDGFGVILDPSRGFLHPQQSKFFIFPGSFF